VLLGEIWNKHQVHQKPNRLIEKIRDSRALAVEMLIFATLTTGNEIVAELN
jgi:hypothetical protein